MQFKSICWQAEMTCGRLANADEANAGLRKPKVVTLDATEVEI